MGIVITFTNNIQIKDNSVIFNTLKSDNVEFVHAKQILGWKTSKDGELSELILTKNNLRCRIIINKNDIIGKNDIANISDILMESAVSTILDCEDSVATVDADDKILAYKNDVKERFIKDLQMSEADAEIAADRMATFAMDMTKMKKTPKITDEGLYN